MKIICSTSAFYHSSNTTKERNYSNAITRMLQTVADLRPIKWTAKDYTSVLANGQGSTPQHSETSAHTCRRTSPYSSALAICDGFSPDICLCSLSQTTRYERMNDIRGRNLEIGVSFGENGLSFCFLFFLSFPLHLVILFPLSCKGTPGLSE